MNRDQVTLSRIEFLHPKVRTEVLEIYGHICDNILTKNVLLRFTYTLRTVKEQDALYAQGRTVSGKRVTDAKGGQSIHNYGLALDIVLLVDKDGNGTYESASWDLKADYDKDTLSDWMEVVNYFKSKGWVWGGNWKYFIDNPHFEKTFGHTWRTLQPLVNSGKVIKDKGINYPNI